MELLDAPSRVEAKSALLNFHAICAERMAEMRGKNLPFAYRSIISPIADAHGDYFPPTSSHLAVPLWRF
ncbi:hypothetical protein RHIZ404_201088 [Rhizobium sp. EC-SD404]|nr:hypothetical protein RHIZ404_201088 [Rhizobium sp. EC-SD404]